MKKKYAAPIILVENLDAAVFTGTSCAKNVYELGGVYVPSDIPGTGDRTVFASQPDCFYIINTPGQLSELGIADDDSFCYMNPNDATRMFAS